MDHVAPAAHQLGPYPEGRRVTLTRSLRNPHSWERSQPEVCPTQGPPAYFRGVSVSGVQRLCACSAPHRLLWAGCQQIEKDLLRTMPSNACFAHVSSVGIPRLRRVLRALAWLYPEIGYCQGTGMVSTARDGGSRPGGGGGGGGSQAGRGSKPEAGMQSVV